jgi:SAM-dependent methyltransferase
MAVSNSKKSLPEKARNRLLRRVDWRFLLPDPLPERSICFTNGLLEEAVKLISKSTVQIWDDSSPQCDLAVAVNPDRATLQAAFKVLRPGGALYSEWYSPLAWGPRGIRNWLEKLGFEKVDCYWAWPLPYREAAQFWLPYEAPAALSYFLKSRSRPVSLKEKAGKTLLYNIWRLGRLTGLVLPVCVVSIKPALALSTGQALARPPASNYLEAARSPLPQSQVEVKPGVEEIIRAGWQTWGFGVTQTKLSWLLLTGGRRSISKVVGLVFASQEAKPRLAVKMPRIVEAIPALYQEAANLAAVHSARPGGFPGVPRVLFCERQGESLVLGETVLTGLPLFTQLRRDNYRELALKATDWLVDLAGQPELEPRSAWWDRLVEPALQEFNESFGSILGQGSLQKARDILAGLGPLPAICEHRDFSPWNVMLADDGELVVLDWEGAELHGLPAMDLIYFLTYLAFFLDNALDSDFLKESYQAVLEPTTFTGRVFSECTARYASRLGLDPSTLRPLRLLTWIFHSRSEYRHFTADMAEKPGDKLLKRSLFVSLWEAELGLDAPARG